MTEPSVLPTDVSLAKIRARFETNFPLARGEIRQLFAALDWYKGQVEGLEIVREAAGEYLEQNAGWMLHLAFDLDDNSAVKADSAGEALRAALDAYKEIPHV